MKTFLNLSISLDSDLPLDELYTDLNDRLEYLFSEEALKVFSITWDRAQALHFVQAQNNAPTRVGGSSCPPPIDSSVATVLAHFNIPLPKPKRGAPEWRTPLGQCWGEVQGLPGLRGKVIATNGIIAFLVREDGKWCDIHWDWFIPDKEEDLPSGIEKPKGRTAKTTTKVEQCFAGF